MTPKRSSTTLQPTLPRASTPTYRRITVRKSSRQKKKSCPNCSALSVHQLHSSSCNRFAIMGKYSFFLH
jgi:ribosomal protein S27AE